MHVVHKEQQVSKRLCASQLHAALLLMLIFSLCQVGRADAQPL